jgi:indole-3-glycerol phosphate synthase
MPDRTILDTILAHKRDEVEARKAQVPERELRSRIADLPPTRGFLEALKHPRTGPTALIAEVKKASPSAGVIRADFEPVSIARAYEAGGAACLSVLTDQRFFQGHENYLEQIRGAVAIPLLRKDFTVDAYQIAEARAIGADAILLIVAALTESQIADYLEIARSLGLAALVEVHTEPEMRTAAAAGADLVGINSRDLKTFFTDLGIVERLAHLAPADCTLVAESGLKGPADVARVRNAGAHAILVGETLMRSPDIGAAIRELMG